MRAGTIIFYLLLALAIVLTITATLLMKWPSVSGNPLGYIVMVLIKFA